MPDGSSKKGLTLVTAWPRAVPVGGRGDMGNDPVTLGDTITFRNGETINNSADGTIAVTADILAASAAIDVGTNLTTVNDVLPIITNSNVYKYQYSVPSGNSSTNIQMTNGAGLRLTGTNIVNPSVSGAAPFLELDVNDEEFAFQIDIPPLYDIDSPIAGDLTFEILCKTMDAASADTVTVSAWTVDTDGTLSTIIINAEELTINSTAIIWRTTATSAIGNLVDQTSMCLQVAIKQINTGEPTDDKRFYGFRLKYRTGISNDGGS